MKDVIEQLIEQKRLHKKTGDKILALDEKAQGQLLNLLHKFNLGINFSKEFVGYILDISKRDNVPVSAIVQEKSILQLAERSKLPHARKMELLRKLLREKRYPYFHRHISKTLNVEPDNDDVEEKVLPKLIHEIVDLVYKPPVFNKIYIERSVEEEPMTKRICECYNNLPTEILDSSHQFVKDICSIGESKTILIVAEQKGQWLERCPGTKEHLCCNYLVVNNAVNCPYDCTYCYLQTYLNKNALTIYANIDGLIGKLREFFASNKAHFRIGTGEFSDSLALDNATGVAGRLIPLFAEQENHLLELKTKSAEVDHLLGIKHKEKTVIAWSVNPEKVIKNEEFGAVSLDQRLAAAQKCVQAGYKVAFHFDPVIFYRGWDKDYKEVVDLIFSSIEPRDIAWISLGALRYLPEMKDVIEKRFPHSRITLGELDVAEDGKLRYFKPIRVEIFRKMHHFIRQHSDDVYVYLCMESRDVWQASGLMNNTDSPYAKYFKFFKKCN